MKTIFLIGYMASGKTTLGRAYAREKGLRFVDLDFYITQRFRRSVAELFAERGEEGFRRLEAAMLEEMAGTEDTVVSCGGGTPCFGRNMELMLENGVVAWLEVEPECVVRRLQTAKTRRPLTEGKSPGELLDFVRRHQQEREPFYSRAHLRLRGEDLEDRAGIGRAVARLDGLLAALPNDVKAEN